VESVAYQASYLFWFRFICAQRGITGFLLHEIFPGMKSKVSRIMAFLKKIIVDAKKPESVPDIYLHEDVRTQVLYQATQFKPNKKDNKDDILDLGGLLDAVLSRYSGMLVTNVSELLESFSHGDKTIEDCCSV
jgi:hypothetical protein